MLLPLVIGIFLGGIVGFIAEQKNRAFFPWAAYGFFFFFLAIIHIAVVGDKAYEKHQLEGKGYKACPSCAEMVRTDAATCRHCRSPLTQGTGFVSVSKSEEESRPCRWCKKEFFPSLGNRCPSCDGLQQHFLKDNPLLIALILFLVIAIFSFLSQTEEQGQQAPTPQEQSLSS